jgi:hypothetical protein
MEDELWKGMEVYLKYTRDFSKQMVEAMRVHQNMQLNISERMISAGQGLQQYLRELPQWTQEAVLLMAERGWFFDLALTLPALGKIAERLSSGHEEEVEEVLVAYFEQETDSIENSLVERFPRRAHLIKAAFRAHRKGDYELCIPVFFAQVDGICYDVTSRNLFSRPKIALYVEEYASHTFHMALLQALAKACLSG